MTIYLLEDNMSETETETMVEIGGQVMTQAQFDAARFPLMTGPVESTPDGGAVETEPWRKDGAGTQLVDGSPATCDAAFNRGYDKGYCEGMKAGAPPVRMPRWDEDPVVLRFGWNDGTRCGNCGERRPTEEEPVKAMQWDGGTSYPNGAHEVIAWVNNNGGQARYLSEGWVAGKGARIAVRTADAWVHATPGDYVVMERIYSDPSAPMTTFRAFTVRESRPPVSSPVQVDGEMDEGVTQTLLAGRTDGVPGNCVQAAVASLLSLPIEAVPHFLLWKLWNYRLREWLEEQGYTISVRSMNSIPAERCIVAGMSPRGVAHVCVAEGGRVVWDPHPSRAGLGRVDEAWFIGEAS